MKVHTIKESFFLIASDPKLVDLLVFSHKFIIFLTSKLKKEQLLKDHENKNITTFVTISYVYVCPNPGCPKWYN